MAILASNQCYCCSFINIIRYDQMACYVYIQLSTKISRTMRRQEIIILNDINKVQKNQAILLEKTKSVQQEFLHAFAQRFLIGQKVIHKNIEESLLFLKGSFANISLRDTYLVFCLDNRIDLIPENYNILKMMITWAQYYPTLRSQPLIPLTQAVFHGNDLSSFNSLEEFISYINFITPDIIKLIKRRGDVDESTSGIKKESQRYNLQKIGAEEIISFLNVVLPKVLYNILLSNEMLPNQLKKQHQTFECLYKIRSLQYLMRSKVNYSNLMRIFIQGLISMDLKVSQQKILMELTFRYFYAYHHDKKQIATDLFVQAYNKLDQSTRFALADQFILFFRIIRKIGKEKFANFLNQKSAWIKEVTSKVTDKSLIGYQKETVKAFNQLDIADVFTVQNGKKITRTFQILQDYSLFYFRVDVVSLDITIRLYYHGEIDSQKKVETMLIEQQKKSGEIKSSIVAARRGIYSFQFDNSYSWINSKTVRYQNVIFSPLQIQSDRYKWISSFFNDVPTNQAIPAKITIIQRVAEKKPEKEYVGTANITKNGPFLNLKITKANHVYQFESQNEDVFVRRFNELVQSAGNIKWTVNGQPLDDTQDIQQLLANPNSKPAQKGREKERQKKEPIKKEKIEINLQQFKEDQSTQN